VLKGVGASGNALTRLSTNSASLALNGDVYTQFLGIIVGSDVADNSKVVAAETTTIDAAGSDITFNNSANDFGLLKVAAANATVVDTNAIDLGDSTITTDFTLTAGGNVTDSGTIVVGGTTDIVATGDDVTLDTAANDFDTLKVAAANATVFDTNAIDLGASTISGTLNVTAAGAITDSGAIKVTGTTTLAAGAANDITLDNLDDFTGAVSITSAKDVTLNGINAIDLGASIISGTLNVTAAGAITDSGALTVTGTTTLAAGTSNDITLNSANDFTGAVSITSAKDVTLNDVNAIDLGASTIRRLYPYSRRSCYRFRRIVYNRNDKHNGKHRNRTGLCSA